jgi:hypothetical protein
VSDEDRIAELLLQWEDSNERGRDMPVEELCQGCPELAAEVAERIESLRRTAWLMRLPQEAPAPSPATARRGHLLGGRYRLDGLIAEGGFGQVWRGFDEELHRPVAVKVAKSPRQGTDDEEALLVEARKAARLKHPGIVPVYDVGRHDGGYFIVSSLIDGQDLGALLRQKPPPVSAAVRIVAEAARHLHHAHRQGFVHRDIKPANILVDSHGHVFVTDFGIALTGDDGRRDDACGTLAYMAPEQLLGGAGGVDARTDVYSLGVVLYQLLTRRVPFEAETPAGLREQILRQQPRPPRSLERGVPREVERICLKCLAKAPADRYPSAEALADDLERWPSRRWTTWRLAGGVLAVTALLLAWLFVRGKVPTGPEPTQVLPTPPEKPNVPSLTGRWSGRWDASDAKWDVEGLVINERPDGTLRGKWGEDFNVGKGRRVGRDQIRFQSDGGSYQVIGRIKNRGERLLLLYTFTDMQPGTAVVGIHRLTRVGIKPPIVSHETNLSGRWSGKYANSRGEVGDLDITLKDNGDGTIAVWDDGKPICKGEKATGKVRWQMGHEDGTQKVEGEFDAETLRTAYTITYPGKSEKEAVRGHAWYIRD